MGATIKEIRSIFFTQGALMTLLGGTLGIILGVIVVWLQATFEFLYITPNLAYPVKTTWIECGYCVFLLFLH